MVVGVPIITESDWGFYQIIVDGVDVTTVPGLDGKDVLTQLGNQTDSEPFGDATLELIFPTFSGRTPYGGIAPSSATPHGAPGIGPYTSWARDWAPVQVNLVLLNPLGQIKGVATKFEGDISSWLDVMGDANSQFKVTAQCVGVLYATINMLLQPPQFDDNLADIASIMAKSINSIVESGSGSLGILDVSELFAGNTGIVVRHSGGWQPMLTSYFADLLALAYVNPLPNGLVGGICATYDQRGYYVIGTDGSIVSFGFAPFFGAPVGIVGTSLAQPASDMDTDPDAYGYAVCALDGGVFAYGSVAYQGNQLGNPNQVVGIAICPRRFAIDPSAPGYWLLDITGGVFAKNAPYYGNATGVGGLYPKNGICRSVGGNGYVIIDQSGAIHGYGDAAGASAGAPAGFHTAGALGDFDCRVASCPGGGYVGINALGAVYNYGGSPFFAPPTPPYMAGIATGVVAHGFASTDGYWICGTDGGVFALGSAPFLGSVPSGQAQLIQWTMTNNPGRQPALKIKDIWTTHASYDCGQIGVQHSLTRDLTMAARCYYGEGTFPYNPNVDGQLGPFRQNSAPNTVTGPYIQVDLTWETTIAHWRNTKYVLPQIGAPLSFPGNLYLGSDTGDTALSVTLAYKARLRQLGYPVSFNGLIDQNTINVTYQIQIQCGITAEKGYIGGQTWAAVFGTSGGVVGSPVQSYIAPLACDPRVAPFKLNADGSNQIDGFGAPILNPSFDYRLRRVEKFENFGTHMSRSEATPLAHGELQREMEAPWAGTLTLTVDPAPGSPIEHRFLLRAGMNIELTNFHGSNILFHISSLSINWQTLEVQCTVDTAGRDAVLVDTILERNRDLSDPSTRPVPTRRQSNFSNDILPEWDAESGAGVIPLTQIAAGNWSIVRVPAGAQGQISWVEFHAKGTSGLSTGVGVEFSVALFSKPVTNVDMFTYLGKGTVLGNPSLLDVNGEDPWNSVPPAAGLIAAWGGNADLAGHSPNQGTTATGGTTAITGDLVDTSSITYVTGSYNYQTGGSSITSTTGWLWVAMWCLSDAQIYGYLHAASVVY